MTPVTTNFTTVYIGAPKDWDPDKHGVCAALPASPDESGLRIVSFWLPTPDELALLNMGFPIRFGVMAQQHPVVFMDVGMDPELIYKHPVTGEEVCATNRPEESLTSVDAVEIAFETRHG